MDRKSDFQRALEPIIGFLKWGVQELLKQTPSSFFAVAGRWSNMWWLWRY